MSEPIDVHAIVKAHLVDNGFHGLWNPDEPCSCEATDIAPCSEAGEIPARCRPGHKVPCTPKNCVLDGDCPWHIAAERLVLG